MAMTEPLVLPADLVLVPVADLPAQEGARIEYEPGDYAITLPRARTTSKIVDADTVEFLKAFEEPKTIVEAVIHYSRANDTDPEETLEAIFPLLQSLIQSRFLVSADSDKAKRVEPFFQDGDHVLGCEIIKCIQLLQDTELYQVRYQDGQLAVLKILRPDHSSAAPGMFDREATILQHLNGTVSPALLQAGTFEGRPYLLMEWCAGVDASVAAEEIRRQPGSADRKKLLLLCRDILEAYAQLHGQKVIHSDVHPRNILVDSDGTIKLIDYGLARLDGTESEFDQGVRGGMGFFFEPEYAQTALTHQPPPQSSAAGEQYALGALLYFFFTGTHYVDFSLERDEMLRQIAQDSPLPFAQHGVQPWPEVEQILARALRKNPAGRFASVTEFASRLREVAAREGQGSPTVIEGPTPVDDAATEAFLNDVLERLEPTGPLYASGVPMAPTCSVNMGAAGIAHALYRIASVRDDAVLLSSADLWAAKAMRDSQRSDAFYNDEKDMTPDTVGRISPYHTLSGVHAVQALTSHARGDVGSQQVAIEAFVDASGAPCENLDLTLGQSSTLLGCSLLLDTVRDSQFLDSRSLHCLGNKVMRDLWAKIDSYAPIRECSELSYLGMAHGWAGLLYATMRWCQSSGGGLPNNLEDRLQQLAACAEPTGRGVRWEWVLSKPGQRSPNNYMPGWCNGSAGYVFLWTLAHQMIGEQAYLVLAEKTAWNTWEEPGVTDNLCCGFAGRAYGLLNLYKHTGEGDWLTRARNLTNRAIAAEKHPDLPRHSLYKGDIGVAVLAADLARPEESCMPFFEQEGWVVP